MKVLIVWHTVNARAANMLVGYERAKAVVKYATERYRDVTQINENMCISYIQTVELFTGKTLIGYEGHVGLVRGEVNVDDLPTCSYEGLTMNYRGQINSTTPVTEFRGILRTMVSGVRKHIQDNEARLR